MNKVVQPDIRRLGIKKPPQCHSEAPVLWGRRIPAVCLNGQAMNVACAPVSLEFHERPIRDGTMVKIISAPLTPGASSISPFIRLIYHNSPPPPMRLGYCEVQLLRDYLRTWAATCGRTPQRKEHAR